jgi:hypothetical protein
MFDYSEAQPQRDLIPHGTIVTLQLTVRAGGAGEDGQLTRSKDGLCEMLDAEFTVVDDGEFTRRKLWERFRCGRHDSGPRQGCGDLSFKIARNP